MAQKHLKILKFSCTNYNFARINFTVCQSILYAHRLPKLLYNTKNSYKQIQIGIFETSVRIEQFTNKNCLVCSNFCEKSRFLCQIRIETVCVMSNSEMSIDAKNKHSCRWY